MLARSYNTRHAAPPCFHIHRDPAMNPAMNPQSRPLRLRSFFYFSSLLLISTPFKAQQFRPLDYVCVRVCFFFFNTHQHSFQGPQQFRPLDYVYVCVFALAHPHTSSGNAPTHSHTPAARGARVAGRFASWPRPKNTPGSTAEGRDTRRPRVRGQSEGDHTCQHTICMHTR